MKTRIVMSLTILALMFITAQADVMFFGTRGPCSSRYSPNRRCVPAVRVPVKRTTQDGR